MGYKHTEAGPSFASEFLNHQASARANTRFRQGAKVMDFSNMGVSDWIIRTAIFGVLACAVVGTLQNLIDALRNRNAGK